MHQIRKSLRNQAVILMGKNTMMRKAMKDHSANMPSLDILLPHVKGNIGFAFTNNDIASVRDVLISNKMKASAKPGCIAPVDVVIKAYNTKIAPDKTRFFQALDIPTKVVRGTIEIIHDVHLIKAGDKVGLSEVELLNLLGMSPFSYGLKVIQVFDRGHLYSPEILDITDNELRKNFMKFVRNVAAVSMQINLPTMASVPHSLASGIKDCLALAAATDISFKEAEMLKEFLANPSKFLSTHNVGPEIEHPKDNVAVDDPSDEDDYDDDYPCNCAALLFD